MIKVHLDKWLAKKHWSQRKLASITGLRPNTINALCREQVSRIDFETLGLICKALDCQPGDLLEYVSESE